MSACMCAHTFIWLLLTFTFFKKEKNKLSHFAENKAEAHFIKPVKQTTNRSEVRVLIKRLQ